MLFNLVEGSNVITITATDTNGNQATDSITVTYAAPDTQAPVVIISAPSVPSGETLQTTQGSLQLSGTAQDDRSCQPGHLVDWKYRRRRPRDHKLVHPISSASARD